MSAPEFRQSDDVLPGRAVVLAVIVAAFVTALLAVVAGLLLRQRETALRPGRRFPERHLAAPALSDAPLYEAPGVAQQHRAPIDAQLHQFGWVDRKRGVVHIPIERAIDRVAQKGTQ